MKSTVDIDTLVHQIKRKQIIVFYWINPELTTLRLTILSPRFTVLAVRSRPTHASLHINPCSMFQEKFDNLFMPVKKKFIQGSERIPYSYFQQTREILPFQTCNVQWKRACTSIGQDFLSRSTLPNLHCLYQYIFVINCNPLHYKLIRYYHTVIHREVNVN